MSQRLTLVLCAFGLGLFTLVQAADEKTYSVDDEGFIRNWVVLDPISVKDAFTDHSEDQQKGVFSKEYFKGQKDAEPKNGDKIKVGDKELTWRGTQADDWFVDFEKTAGVSGGEATNALYLMVTYVIADKDMEGVKLSIGSDDSSLWSLNGKEVIRVYAGRAYEKDQDTAANLTLKKGINVLKAAVINGEGPTGAGARFQDKDGNAIKGLKVQLAPAKE